MRLKPSSFQVSWPGTGSLVGGQGQQAVVHGQPHRVEAHGGHGVDVGLGGVVVEPGLVDLGLALLAPTSLAVRRG
jgi:hypothetical protein